MDIISKTKPKTKILLTLIALLLCLSLISLPASSVTAGSSKTSKQLNEAREKAKEIKKQLGSSQKELDQLKSSTQEKSKDLAWLEKRTKEQQEAYEEALTRKNNALLIMEQTSMEYEAAVAEYERQIEAYGERLVLMFQLPQQSIFEALLSSGDLQTYFSTNRLMRIISDTDELILDRLLEAEAHAEEMKMQTEASYEDMQRLVAEADELLAEIKANRDISAQELKKANAALSEAEEESLLWAAEMKSIEDDISSLQKKYSKELAEEEAKRKAAEEAKRKAAQAAKQKAETKKTTEQKTTTTSSKGWTWPVPSSKRITSYYGYRTIFGARSFHYGIDIAAPTGTKIVAAKPGVVLICTYHSISGNYVGIDHGGGVITYYRHLSKFACKAGQKVAAGQLIGYIGSTGRSTGPHLHFDIRINGTYVNPLKYVS